MRATRTSRREFFPVAAGALIEHMANAQEYDRSRQFLFDLGEKIGVRFA